MKNGFLFITVLFIFSSCTALKSLIHPVKEQVPTVLNSPFIETISIKPETNLIETKRQTNTANSVFVTKEIKGFGSPLESYTSNQFKYAIELNVPVETIQNKALYNFIDDWWRTPYRMGGSTKNGVDCSAFVQTLMIGVFALQLPRTAREQKSFSVQIPFLELKEGDLVFFNTRRGVSHVGVYLHNNKFVHASTSNGVMISDLNDSYWSKKFIAAGRIVPNSFPMP